MWRTLFPVATTASLTCPRSLEYDVLATTLKRVLEADSEAFSAERLERVTVEDLQAWFGANDMPLLVCPPVDHTHTLIPPGGWGYLLILYTVWCGTCRRSVSLSCMSSARRCEHTSVVWLST